MKRSQSGCVSFAVLPFLAVPRRFRPLDIEKFVSSLIFGLEKILKTVLEFNSNVIMKIYFENHVNMKWQNYYSLGNLKWNAHVDYIIVTASLLINVFRSCLFCHLYQFSQNPWIFIDISLFETLDIYPKIFYWYFPRLCDLSNSSHNGIIDELQ